MRTYLSIAILGLMLVQFVSAQSTDRPPAVGSAEPALSGAAPEDIAFFEQRVRPLLIARCFECHASLSDKPNGGLVLDSRDAIVAGGDNGPAALIGQPRESLLVEAIHYGNAEFAMPPSGKLSDREIETLEEWVRRGLPFPSSSVSTKQPVRQIDIAEGKKHWSFQPLSSIKESDIATARADWAQRPLDLFILKQQEQLGLSPSATAAPAALLRRVKYDLIGLPPTVTELDAFLADGGPDAFERQVDAWLASPQYGERWSRFWLELVRYCDIAESWAESEGNGYHYRDWVVNAFNCDEPFDRFAQLQIAADHMADARSSDLAALGLFGLSPSYWKELQLPVEIIKTIVADEYEERIHTFSSTFLGLNIACARCHDHKNDPITVEDYYALAGIFASTRTADRALAVDVDSLQIYTARREVRRLEAERTRIDSEIAKLKAEQAVDAAKLAEHAIALAKVDEQLVTLRATPGYNAPLTPGVLDSSLEVKEAVGTHGSRLVYDSAPKNSAIEIRGNPNRLGAIVPRRYVAVLSHNVPTDFTEGSGRLELAQALFKDSQPLVARVIVNRIWKQHFGRGLVDTTSDFGVMGDAPSHPLLLDDLAMRFIQHEWSIKWLHREILLSATYQQSVGVQDERDPSNAYYTSAPLRRLDVEQWRDAMLMVSGSLDASLGGPPVELGDSNNHRRTLYGTVRRRELNDVLRLHDFPDPVTHSPSRTSTTTPLQQLFTLNSPFMLEQASALSLRIAPSELVGATDTEGTIAHLIKTLFSRPPLEREIELGRAFVSSGGDTAWSQYIQILLGSNAFHFID